MNNKFLALACTLICLVSALVLPLASCVEYGIVSIDSNSFDRYHCYYHESTYGYPTTSQYDTACITAVFNDYAYNNKYIQARLFKFAWGSENGLTSLYTVNECWIDDDIRAFVGYPPSFVFYHHLDFSGIVWPDDPLDVVSECGTAFGNLEWNVCYRINWWVSDDGYTWAEIGWSDELPGYKVWTVHDEMEPEDNNFIICSCCTHFACHTAWTDVYGTASVSNAQNGHGRTQDGSYATIRAQSSGATARICYDLTSLDSGHVWIYGNSLNSPSSRVLVYCSPSGSSWILASDQTVSNGANRWIDCGDPGVCYRYVLIIAYDDGSSDSWLSIDAVNTGGHY